ncbi:MAG: hypothetical protein NTZ83_01350 [Candidatus Pacearchaeota archaeon]|nr:hypothetical protein [Candidatus Pacearchaeota archaeon]
MNKNLAIISGVFFVLLMVGVVYAASNESTPKGIYGQCVSENAIMKNSCFATNKQVFESCKASVPQDDTRKDALKQCKLTYKTEKKQCKAVFKGAKNLCKKTRDSAETLE